MYPDGGVVGIVAVAPVILFLVSYLVYTQAPKYRYGKSDIRTASDARTKFLPDASDIATCECDPGDATLGGVF
jgi:hypothetical protein